MSFYYLQQDLNLTNQSSVERQMEFDNELEQDTDLALFICTYDNSLFIYWCVDTRLWPVDSNHAISIEN